MKTDLFAIMRLGDTNDYEDYIVIDHNEMILAVKMHPDFEKETKLSRIEHWIISRVFNRLTNQ